MKRLITNGLVFVGASIGLYLLCFAVLYYVPVGDSPMIYRVSQGLSLKGGDAYEKFEEFDRQVDPTLVIMGSSMARQDYDPRLFEKGGWKAFNLGTSAQSMVQSYELARHYLRGKKGTVLLLDLFPGAFYSDGFESSSDLIQNVSSHWTACRIAWKLQDIRAVNMLTLRLLSRGSDPEFEDKRYVGKGFVERRDSVEKEVDYQMGTLTFKVQQIRAFQQLLTFCHTEGIEVVMVSHPLPREYEYGKIKDFLTEVQKLAYEVQKNPILMDFTRVEGLNSRDHYYDHHHLNQAGVEIFNPKLIQKLNDQFPHLTQYSQS
ncbi:MAG: hypothetical protein AAFP00_13795, partial [Bacteroidota bacterium]